MINVSVRRSVTLRYCVQTAQRIVEILPPYSPNIPVFCKLTGVRRKFRRDQPLTGTLKNIRQNSPEIGNYNVQPDLIRCLESFYML